MRGKYGGPYTVDELFKVNFIQSISWFYSVGIQTVTDANLYFRATNALGKPVIIRNSLGHPIEGFDFSTPYSCAADEYENMQLQPTDLVTPSKPTTILKAAEKIPTLTM